MLVQHTPASIRVLTCTRCSEAVPFTLTGITEHTRYTCARCCNRIAVERGSLGHEMSPFVPTDDPDVRQVVRYNELYGNAGAEADDVS